MRDQLVLRPIGIRMLETLSACCQRTELHIPGELIAVALLSLNQTARLKTNLYADYLVIAFGGQVRTSSRRPGWFVCALVRRTARARGQVSRGELRRSVVTMMKPRSLHRCCGRERQREHCRCTWQQPFVRHGGPPFDGYETERTLRSSFASWLHAST